MEFQFDLSHIAHDQIIKIDNSLLPVGYQKDDPESVLFLCILTSSQSIIIMSRPRVTPSLLTQHTTIMLV